MILSNLMYMYDMVYLLFSFLYFNIRNIYFSFECKHKIRLYIHLN